MNTQDKIFSNFISTKKQDILKYKVDLENENNSLRSEIDRLSNIKPACFKDINKRYQILQIIQCNESIISDIETQKEEFKTDYDQLLLECLNYIAKEYSLQSEAMVRFILDAYDDLEICNFNNITNKNHDERMITIENSIKEIQPFFSQKILLDKLPKKPRDIIENLKIDLKIIGLNDEEINSFLKELTSSGRVPRIFKKKSDDKIDQKIAILFLGFLNSNIVKKFVK